MMNEMKSGRSHFLFFFSFLVGGEKANICMLILITKCTYDSKKEKYNAEPTKNTTTRYVNIFSLTFRAGFFFCLVNQRKW